MNKLAKMIVDKYNTVVRMTEETGIPGSTIYSMIRDGINTATVSNALKIAKALDTTIEELAESDKEYPKLTKYEKETLERMRDVEYSWIARNGYGYINIFFYEPSKTGDYWVNGSNSLTMDIYDKDFDFIKWTDEEPWNIKELLENCEVEK